MQETKFGVRIHRNKAVLICDSIALYDRMQRCIGVVKQVRGTLLSTDSISLKMFSLGGGDDRCDLHRFVKVSGGIVNGWVYGKTVFEQENAGRDSNFSSGGIDFKFMPLRNFNIGVYDAESEMLSFCDNPAPVLMYNSLFNRAECIPVQPVHEMYAEGYFTLDQHDAWEDKIISAEYNGTALHLKLLRTYQEGYAHIEVLLYLHEKQSYANVISVFKREE